MSGVPLLLRRYSDLTEALASKVSPYFRHLRLESLREVVDQSDTPVDYRDTSLIRNRAPLGPCSRTISRVLRWSWGGMVVSYELLGLD